MNILFCFYICFLSSYVICRSVYSTSQWDLRRRFCNNDNRKVARWCWSFECLNGSGEVSSQRASKVAVHVSPRTGTEERKRKQKHRMTRACRAESLYLSSSLRMIRIACLYPHDTRHVSVVGVRGAVPSRSWASFRLGTTFARRRNFHAILARYSWRIQFWLVLKYNLLP